MKRFSLALLFALLVMACSSDTSATTEGSSATTADSATTTADIATTTTADSATTAVVETTTPAATEGGATVQVATSDLGEILTDAEGMTLYLFTPDEQSDPTCYDQCAENWPPLTESVAVGAGLDASLLAPAPRADDTEQVTYNGWPLYYFIGDEAPGDVNGQGLNDIWWVMDATGEAISS
ncbi:MAG: COG4315 family predicted lipoprotein [Acidimicrobiia bacterium]